MFRILGFRILALIPTVTDSFSPNDISCGLSYISSQIAKPASFVPRKRCYVSMGTEISWTRS